MLLNKPLVYKLFGNKAVIVQWHAVIDENILNDILVFKQKIENYFPNNEIQDTVVGYNSLTIIFINEIQKFTILKTTLKNIYKSTFKVKKENKIVWQIPVCYDPSFGVDLDLISLKTGLSKKQIIELHSKPLYSVFFIGFLPGFLYLGGLNKQLYLERKSTPRLLVEKGTVAIGGKQTGIYPQQSAGGWNCIGKTPVSFFNVEQKNPCFAKPGDKINFVPISKKDFFSIEEKIKDNTFSLNKTILDA